jgi:hypothetical protein
MPTEADTCRKFVVPKLQSAGWENEPHSIAEQRSIAVFHGEGVKLLSLVALVERIHRHDTAALGVGKSSRSKASFPSSSRLGRSIISRGAEATSPKSQSCDPPVN